MGHSPRGLEEWDTTEQLHFHFSLSCIREGNGSPLQCSCLRNPRDGGAWWAAIYGVAQSLTRLKRLSSSSSIGKCKESDDTAQSEGPYVSTSFPTFFFFNWSCVWFLLYNNMNQPPPPHPTPLGHHRAELPVLCSSSPLAICLFVVVYMLVLFRQINGE